MLVSRSVLPIHTAAGRRMQPILDTPRLRLKPVADEDFEALWALWTEPQVRKFLWDDLVIARDQARETIRDFETLAAQGLGLWTVAQRETASGLIGCAALAPVSTAAQYYPSIAGAVEPLVALASAWWHRGYALETLRALVEHARETLRLDRLVGVTDVPNVSSDRLLRKGGFVPCAETDGPCHRLRHYRLELTPESVDPNRSSAQPGRHSAGRIR
jgi:[ribosomal protein S5]-alanine N-acetyltransferase